MLASFGRSGYAPAGARHRISPDAPGPLRAYPNRPLAVTFNGTTGSGQVWINAPASAHAGTPVTFYGYTPGTASRRHLARFPLQTFHFLLQGRVPQH